jgi:hypothetical protein
MLIKQYILILLISLSTLFGSDIEDLLSDIQQNNKIDLSKYNLHQGWNEKDKTFISIGFSIFDFNKVTFLDDRRKYSLVAFMDAKANISEFISSKMDTKDEIFFSKNKEYIKSDIQALSDNILKNSFTIFQVENFVENENLYTIQNYMIWTKDLQNIRIKTNLSIKQYIDNLNISNMLGNRYFIDTNGNHFILNFSLYKITNNIWQDRLSSKQLAKRDIISMLESDLQSTNKLSASLSKDTQYNSKQKQNINSINIKNIKIEIQKKFINKFTGQKYFITVVSYKRRNSK